MQKKLIALAVAGLVAAPAFAQSNVTVYGLADVGVGYGKAGDAKFTGIVGGVLSGNRFGLKGTEDLGNGLKALFVLEQGYNIGDGSPASSRQFHRQSWAGLQGGFGTVGLGRQYAPGFLYTANFDTVAAGPVDPQSILSLKAGMTITPNSAARWDNSVKYTLPAMGGVKAEAIYSFNSVQSDSGAAGAPDRTDDDKIGLGVGFASGPIDVGVVYHKLKGAVEDTNEYYLAGSYNLGVAKLVLSYQVKDLDDNKDKLAFVGAIVPVGKGNVHLGFGALNPEGDDNNSRSFSLGYTHGLSKRTTGYVAVNRTTNDDASGTGGEPLVAASGEDSTAVVAGFRHTF